MEEYILKTATQSEWQKWLNQWKHEYHIVISAMTENNGNVTLLIKRVKK